MKRSYFDDPRLVWLIVLIALAVGLLLRLNDLGLRSISHPEVYVPGIPLPPAHVIPPPRLTWADTFRMHFHDEPHPMGWYWAMFAWTKLAGTAEWALRLPSAIIGAATAWVAFLLGRRVFGPAAGALAAGLMALHGFHVYWSQEARMYTAGAFFGVLATWALLGFVYDERRRALFGATYVLSILAMAECVEFVWPLLGIQIAWAAIVLPHGGGFRWSEVLRPRLAGAHPVFVLQAIATMVSAPELLHSAYRARPEAVEQYAMSFLTEYLGFGFLFATDRFAIPELGLPLVAALAMAALAVALVVSALRGPALRPRPVQRTGHPRFWPVMLLAVAMTATMVWLALIARQRTALLLVISAGPLLALWIPTLARGADHLMAGQGAIRRWRGGIAGPRFLAVMIGMVAPAVMFAASAKIEILAPRVFLVFVPCFLVLIAGGAVHIASRWLRWISVAAVVLLFAASNPFNHARPGSPNDYKGIVAAMRADYRPDDLIFVLDKSWVETPFFYYLPEARGVFSDYSEALRNNPEARVWLVTWPWPAMPVINDERREALAQYTRIAHVTALRASAELFVPPGN